MRMNLLTMIVMILLIFIFALHPPSVMWSPRKVIGAVIAGLSFPLFLLAHWQLGASFSVKAKARALVTTGIYSKIRNPIYFFSGLVLVGLSLFLSIWGAVGGGRGDHPLAGLPCAEGRAGAGGRFW
jgi:protein-S-isoprenylcysteine O-methyltransferase Ste14